MTRLADAIRQAAHHLAAAGVEAPVREARLLAQLALGLSAGAVAVGGDRVLDAAEAARLAQFTERRAARIPFAYLAGEKEFWSLPFRVTPDVLIPRPETETVVEAVLRHLGDRQRAVRILDLGTGSGCLLVALLHELPNAFGIGADRSLPALSVARGNAEANGVASRAGFVCADWAAPLAGPFDVIVSNPPYIDAAEIDALEPDVRQEPIIALTAGPDTLFAYRTIVAAAPRLLASGGILAFELGQGLDHDVRDLVAASAFEVLHIAPDLAEIPRALIAAKKGLGGPAASG